MRKTRIMTYWIQIRNRLKRTPIFIGQNNACSNVQGKPHFEATEWRINDDKWKLSTNPVWFKQTITIQDNAIQLYCLWVEKFAFLLVIYIKHSIHLTIKRQQLNEARCSNTRKILNKNRFQSLLLAWWCVLNDSSPFQ